MTKKQLQIGNKTRDGIYKKKEKDKKIIAFIQVLQKK